jgi:hypothetical protein
MHAIQVYGPRFRRDSAGDSFEVVHDQRQPTRFDAQNRQFQAHATTTNDTRGVRALLRCVASNCSAARENGINPPL